MAVAPALSEEAAEPAQPLSEQGPMRHSENKQGPLTRPIRRFNFQPLGVLVLLAALITAGCGSSGDSATGGQGNQNACNFTALATTATFQRDITTNALTIGVTAPAGAVAYSIDFCMSKPHTAGIKGIRADVTHTAGLSSSDANLFLAVYETTGGFFIFTEIFINNLGQAVYAVERCDINDNCTILQAPTNILTGLSLASTYKLSIRWDGATTLTYDVTVGATGNATFNIPAGNPIVDDQLTFNDVAFGVFASGGPGTATGVFDNVEISTDGTNFTLYDDFTTANTTGFTGGGKWVFEEGRE